jgi:uncharacterized membrane protein
LPEQALFCPGCGDSLPVTTVAKSSPPPATVILAAETQPLGRAPVQAVNRSSKPLPMPENIAAVIAYITIIPAIVFLYLNPFRRNRFVRFHAYQHVFLWVAALGVAIVASLLWAVLQLMPFMRVLVFPFTGLIGLAWFFLWLLLVVKAYRHEMFKLPIIGDLAEQRTEA